MPLDKMDQILMNDVLAKIGFFPFLSKSELDEIYSRTSSVSFEKGERIIREGSSGGAFYILASGKVSIAKKKADGQDVSLAEIESGSYFGEVALISASVRTTSVIAEERVKVFSIGKRDFAEIFMNNQQIRKILEKKSSTRMEDTKKKAVKLKLSEPLALAKEAKKARIRKESSVSIGLHIIGKLKDLIIQQGPQSLQSYKTRILDDPELTSRVKQTKNMIESDNADDWFVNRNP